MSGRLKLTSFLLALVNEFAALRVTQASRMLTLVLLFHRFGALRIPTIPDGTKGFAPGQRRSSSVGASPAVSAAPTPLSGAFALSALLGAME